MIERYELNTITRTMGKMMREYVLLAKSELSKRLDEFDARLRNVPAGPRGETGPAGKDAIGERGQQGERGEPGIAGMAGPRGDTGVAGMVGQQGPIGPQGEIGIIGPRGEVGLTGLKGDQGERGPTGERGEHGIAGVPGAQGAIGETGDRGERGEPGQIGLIGPQGTIGERGATGERGLPGESIRGAVGAIGPQGEKGPIGERGIQGERGDRGLDGREGINGRDGRDASEIEIVESVVEGRHYAKGTLGIINGAIYRSTGDSWALLIPAPKSVVDVREEKSGRITTNHHIYNDGTEKVTTIKGDEMIWRDVWTDREYERGDVVTHDGSLWHCQAGKTRARPGGNTRDWKLCRKRDGKASADGGDKEVMLQELVARIAVLEAALADGISPKDGVQSQANPTALIRIEQPTAPKTARTKKVGNVTRMADGSMSFILEEKVLEEHDGA